jgi:AAA+ ATPase superfamily predicted ATPase
VPDKGNRISGRRVEIEVLDKAAKSSDPEFIAIYGRRRVGKTFLIREFFGGSLGGKPVNQAKA